MKIKLPAIKVKTPANEPKKDARFRRSRNVLRKVLHAGLAERRICLRPTDVCNAAEISRPAFYDHWRSTDDALQRYEADLKQGFLSRLPASGTNKSVIFTILLSFMRDDPGYFRASVTGANFWLLRSLFDEIRPMLVGKLANDKSYDLYVYAQIALICCWVKHDDLSAEKMPMYVNKLCLTRVLNLGI